MRVFVLLLLLWLVLNESAAPGHLLLGAAIALGGSAVFARLQRGLRGRKARRPWTALRLGFIVAADVVRANVAVGRIVLGLKPGPRTAGPRRFQRARPSVRSSIPWGMRVGSVKKSRVGMKLRSIPSSLVVRRCRRERRPGSGMSE